jgi:CTP:molybdopterin cytidylyltransferase MocA
MGSDKLSLPIDGVSPLERIARLLVERTVVLVTSEALYERHASLMPSSTVVVNERPQDGMTSSLRAAAPLVAESDRTGVLLGDKPLLLRSTLERLENQAASLESDVAYPQSGSAQPGHPVYLSHRAILTATRLPDGDTLRMLRSDPSLSTSTIECADPGAYFDIDIEEDRLVAERLARGEPG